MWEAKQYVASAVPIAKPFVGTIDSWIGSNYFFPK